MTRGRWLIPLAAMGLWAADYEVPDLKMVLPANPRDLREAVERFARDEEALIRFYPVAVSPARIKALGRFYSEWRRALDTAPLEGLDIHGKVDWVAFRNHLDNELRQMRFAEQRLAEMQPVLPLPATSWSSGKRGSGWSRWMPSGRRRGWWNWGATLRRCARRSPTSR